MVKTRLYAYTHR